ncbi:MAG: Asp/Glu racemase [Marinovum sp.]|nr:Asp/Glu racemase [Marinovum sp.]
MRQTYPYLLDDRTHALRMGLIVLQSDETIERDFHQIFAPSDTAIYVTRVPSGAKVTPDTLQRMAIDLPEAAALFPPVPLDVVGYACTSGASQIGSSSVADCIKASSKAKHVTDPLSAARAAFETLRLKKVGLVSPYIASVAAPLEAALSTQQTKIVASLSFGEADEAKVARISRASLADAARALAQAHDLDGVFLSCTNLRTLALIEPLEQELGLAILSSNQVIAWHMSKLSGTPVTQGSGRLFQQPMAPQEDASASRAT